jgi:acyl-CoA synthetase (AMP-forming)/AMP-acid ligase II
VAEEAVIGVPDPKWTERPQALLVAEADQEVSEVQIRTQLKNFAAKGIVPRYSVPGANRLGGGFTQRLASLPSAFASSLHL